MGKGKDRTEKRSRQVFGFMVKRLDDLEERVKVLEAGLGHVAQASGSALAVEALTEIAGRREVGEMMAELLKKKQAEREGDMAARVKAALDEGKLVPIEEVTARCLMVAQRKGGGQDYRVDVATPQMPKERLQLYLGKKVGDVVDEVGIPTPGAEPVSVSTTILELYAEGKPPPAVQAAKAALEAEADLADAGASTEDLHRAIEDHLDAGGTVVLEQPRDGRPTIEHPALSAAAAAEG